MSFAPIIVTQPTGIIVLAGETALFYGSATGGQPLNYTWYDQINGVTGIGVTGIVGETGITFPILGAQPSDAGIYSFVASNSDGSVESSAATLTVNYPFTYSITPNPTKIGITVTFSVTFIGPASSNLYWDFGDGSLLYANLSPSTTVTTTHTYSVAGFYNAILKLDYSLGTEEDHTYPVTISDLSAGFTVVPDGSRAPFTGLYSNISVGSLTGIFWNFGVNGYPQTIVGYTGIDSVYDFYTGPGTYHPSITVYDIYGFSDTATKDVIVTDPLDIQISPTPSNVPQILYFNPLNDSGAVSWSWTLEYYDPILVEYVIVDQFTTTDPSDKIYSKNIKAPTTYTISLEIIDGSSVHSYASKTFTNTDTYSVDYLLSSSNVPSIAQFSVANLNSSNIDYITWNFGDGHIDSTNNYAPTHTYTTSGTYTGSAKLLWVMNNSSTSAYTETKTATVVVGNPSLIIDFSRTPSRGHKPLVVNFQGISNNPVSSWSWSLHGVGVIGTTQSLEYVFSSAGVYYVTLTVVDQYASPPESITKSITVYSDLSTPDGAIDPNDLTASEAVQNGSGSVTLEDVGATVSLSSSVENPSPTGFKRAKGPTIIFD